MTGAGQDNEQVAPLPGNDPGGFGRYQVFASLGRGGMADVYLAVARGPMGFNKLVVIKRLRPQLAQEEGFRDMFLDEARLAARLNHPNVIHTYEVGESHGSFYIAMEYLEGQPLNKIIGEALKNNLALDEGFCARIIADACNGLHHAHELRDYDGRPLHIIHRDVSPHNVFVTYDGQVKLVDFGIAKAASSSTETEVGVLKGKVAYMAPEQAMGGRIDARADIFAMGIVLWELVSKKRLMAGENAANTLHRLMNEPIPALSSAAPGVDPRLEAIAMRALEKEPERRFASAREMRDALESFLVESGHPVRQDDVGQRVAVMFEKTREEVKAEVQRYMSALSTPPASLSSSGAGGAGASQRVQAMSISSIDEIDRAGGNANAQLLNLADSGARAMPSQGGSAKGARSGSSPQARPGAATVQTEREEGSGKRRGALVLLFALFAAAGVVALVFAMRARPRAGEGGAASSETASSASSANAGPANSTSGSATSGSTPSAQASTVPVATTPPASSTPAAVSPAPAPPHGVTHSRTPRTPAPRTPSPSPQNASPAPAPAEGPPGFLTLDTYPWTRVSEGGRTLGVTPIVRLSLSPGAHVLLLENPDQGIRQSYSVTIKSGETVSRRLGLK